MQMFCSKPIFEEDFEEFRYNLNTSELQQKKKIYKYIKNNFRNCFFVYF